VDKYFSEDALKKSVHASLNDAFQSLPDGKSGGVFIDASSKDDVKLIVAAKVNGHVQVATSAAWDGHKVDGKVSAAITW
jgi:hypothetical protein